MSEDNVFAPPQEEGQANYQEPSESIEDMQRLLYCMKPLLTAVPWILISAISMIIMIGVVVRQMLQLGAMPVIIGLFPLAAGIALAYAAVNIKRGAKSAASQQIHKGCRMMKLAMMILAILILVYIGFIFYMIFAIGR